MASNAERQKLYRLRHPDRVKAARIAGKERDKKWRDANRAHLNSANRKWYSENKEQVSLRQKAAYDPIKKSIRTKAFYAANREESLTRTKEWRDANPEWCKRFKKDWIEKNREHYLERSKQYSQVSRDIRKHAIPKWANVFFMREFYDLAKLRTKCLGVKFSVDHIVPLQSPIVCGLHVETNLKIIPVRSNIIKGNRHWPDMP